MIDEEHFNSTTVKVREQEKVVGVKKWVIVLILSMIPFLNIVIWIVWLASEKTNSNLKNYAAASFIILGVFILLSLLHFFMTNF